MKFFSNVKLSVKLPLILVAISIFALTIMGVSAYRSASAILAVQSTETLEQSVQGQARQIQDWAEQVEANLRATAANAATARALRDFSAAWRRLGDDAPAYLEKTFQTKNPYPAEERYKLEFSGDVNDYSIQHRSFHPGIVVQNAQWGYDDFFLISPDGRVLYSMAKGQEFAQDLMGESAAASPLKALVRSASEAEAPSLHVSEFSVADGTAGGGLFALMPVTVTDGRLLGFVAIRAAGQQITQILDAGGAGEGVAYIADNKGRVRAGQLETPNVDLNGNTAIGLALRGEAGTRQAVGAMGEQAMLAYRPMQLFGVDLALVAEVPTAQVFAPARKLAGEMAFHASWNILLMIALSWALARSISGPLVRIGDAIRKIAGGDREDAVEIGARKDEIGEIANALETLRFDLAVADETMVQSVMQGTAFDASSAAMMIVDHDFRIIHCNKAQFKLLDAKIEEFRKIAPDLSSDNIVGKSMDVFHKLPERARSILRDPKNLPYHTDIAVGDGRFGLDVSEITDETGAQIGFVVEWRDVTALRMHRALLDVIEARQIICELSPAMQIRRVNHNVEAALQIDGNGLIGAKFEDVVEVLGYKGDYEAELRDFRPVIGRFRFKSSTGQQLIADGSITPVPDRNNIMLKLVLIANDVTEAQTNLAHAQQRTDQILERQQMVFDALRVGLNKLSDGDLCVRLEDGFSEEHMQLRDDFNLALEKLSAAMETVIGNALEIDGEANEITRAAEDLSQRTEKQAATLEQTAAALDELTSSVRSSADGVAEADRVVVLARRGAESSGEIVKQAVEAMTEIDDSSKEISKIIGVIDEIAFQTNLLALNAGVEAARAGEAGRGFAVVASEVRALAQRSSDAAREIDALITASTGHVRRGVDLVGEAGQALEGILNSVNDVAKRVSDIASGAKEQSIGLQEINSAMNQLDQVTQQNAAMFEQTTAASHSLSRGAATLRATVGQFRTRSASLDQMEPKATKITPAITASQHSASSTFVTGNAALESAPTDEEWENF